MENIQIAENVVIRDISDTLLHSDKKQYRIRRKPITTLFVHHSGADSGINGMTAWMVAAAYHVKTKGWPGIAYHFGINLRRAFDRDGNNIIYRLNPDHEESYHTKGCKKFGIGLCLQGHHGKTPLSNFQIECLSAFLPWWFETYHRDIKKDLGWHSNAFKWLGIPKPACPGKHAVSWLKAYKENT